MGMGAKSILLFLAVSAPPAMRSTYWWSCCCTILLRRRLMYSTSRAAHTSQTARIGDTCTVTPANRSSNNIYSTVLVRTSFLIFSLIVCPPLWYADSDPVSC